MNLSINDLIRHLNASAASVVQNDPAKPADSVWIRFSTDKTHTTFEYRTADDNQILHIYVDENGALLGMEIFP